MRKPSQVQEMRLLVKRLRSLMTPGETARYRACAVEDEHKEGVKNFVRSWCLPIAERALARLERERNGRKRRAAHEKERLERLVRG